MHRILCHDHFASLQEALAGAVHIFFEANDVMTYIEESVLCSVVYFWSNIVGRFDSFATVVKLLKCLILSGDYV